MKGKIATYWQWLVVPVLGSVLGVSACSAGRPPLEHLSTADLAVRRAADAGAAQYAPLELRIAREKLDGAKRAIDSKKYDQARRLAEQSQVDARLAETKAESARARQTVEETRKNIETLRHEAERTPTGY